MSSNEWEEVKRLAADFQRAQLTSAVQKLSEKNCIEIVNKLVESRLLDVVFTVDGKEYITPQYVLKEIKDELYVHGGRIALIDLAHLLNVDINVINAQLPILEGRDDCKVLMGNLLNQTYINKLSEEISDKLEQQGSVNINELIKLYDLPADFLQAAIKRNQSKPGKKIYQDSYDEKVFYTSSFLSRSRSIVRGALLALTKPVNVSNIIKRCEIQENVFHSVYDILAREKQIPGILSEKHGSSCTYIPHVYSKKQNEWAFSFLRQNGYIEFDALNRLGIAEPHLFVKNHFQSDKLLILPSAAVGQQLISQVEATIEEILATGSWMDIMDELPSVFEPEDGAAILKEVLKRGNFKNQPQIYSETVVISEEFIKKIIQHIRENLLVKRVESAVSSGDFLKTVVEAKMKDTSNKSDSKDVKANRKDERRKVATSGKGGGGTQGRETKTKTTKKKYLNRGKAAPDDSDEDTSVSKKSSSSVFEFLSVDDLLSVVEKLLLEASENIDCDLSELSKEIALEIYPSLNKEGFIAAQKQVEEKIANSSSDRRKTAANFQDRITALFHDIKLFEKGIKHFPSKDVQKQLVKYLLKTQGTQLVNLIFHYVSEADAEPDTFVPETRTKIIADVDEHYKSTLINLNKSLALDSFEDFITVIEETLSAISVVIKKQDKKKERPFLAEHKQALLSQLEDTKDPAVTLHLVALILFQTATQSMLSASGKFVSTILSFLEAHLPAETSSALKEFHDLVLKFLTVKEDDEKYSTVLAELHSKIPEIKTIAKTYKKTASS